MSVEITGVHPYAETMGKLVESEVEELAESIREVGQLNPVIVTQDGLLVDGRNRRAACVIVSIDPVVQVREFASDDEIADFVIAANTTRRHRTTGQRAMSTGLVMEAAGRRVNGRWKRGSVDISGSTNIGSQRWRDVLAQVGLVLDVRARADQLGPEFAMFIDQPTQVVDGEMTLDAAHKFSQQFEEKAAMAEMALWLPLTKVVGNLEQLSIEAESAQLPTIDAPMRKQLRAQLDDTAKRFKAAATAINDYLKECK